MLYAKSCVYVCITHKILPPFPAQGWSYLDHVIRSASTEEALRITR